MYAFVRARPGREEATARIWLWKAKPTEGFEPSTPALRERSRVSRAVAARRSQALSQRGLRRGHIGARTRRRARVDARLYGIGTGTTRGPDKMRMVHAVSRWSEGRRRDRPRTGFRVTARDEEIVRWIGRLRMATAAQVAARFGLGRAVTYARLGGLLQLGLLEHVRIFHGEPGVYCATRPGLSVTGLELPPARIDIRSYAHDVYLSALVIDLEREFRPEQITTEREMRAMDTSSHQTPTGRSASGSNLRERMASSSSHPRSATAALP
jgi:hypothetical protein